MVNVALLECLYTRHTPRRVAWRLVLYQCDRAFKATAFHDLTAEHE
jgi:hypothetical protein